MRNARKLLLVAAMAVTAMALAAPSAFAVESVEVEETGGGHCNPECAITAINSGFIDLYNTSGASEVVLTSCNNTFTGTVTESGEAVLTEQTITAGQSTCGTAIRECTDPGTGGDVPWHIQIEEVDTGVMHAEANFCLQAAYALGAACLIDAEIEVEADANPLGGTTFTAHHVTPVTVHQLIPVGPNATHHGCEERFSSLGIEGVWDVADVEAHHL